MAAGTGYDAGQILETAEASIFCQVVISLCHLQIFSKISQAQQLCLLFLGEWRKDHTFVFGAKIGWRDQGQHGEMVKRKLGLFEDKQLLE